MIIYKNILDKMLEYYKGEGKAFVMSEANLIKVIEELGAMEYKGMALTSAENLEEDKIYLV